jgi:hypothetical protein
MYRYVSDSTGTNSIIIFTFFTNIQNETKPRTGVKFTANEADYWGTITQIDAAVGR